MTLTETHKSQMNTGLPLFAIGLVFGAGIGFLVAAGNEITLDGHDHSDPAHHGAAHTTQAGENAAHDHGQMLMLPVSAQAPSLALEALKDPMAGWNLYIQTENFTFSPENASLDHVNGEGHAHVYINGEKLGRFYAPWVHLDNLPAGEVTVEVTLNANDHRPLAVGSDVLSAEVKLQN